MIYLLCASYNTFYYNASNTKKEKSIMKELEKIYNPKRVEDKIYSMWLDEKYFCC